MSDCEDEFSRRHSQADPDIDKRSDEVFGLWDAVYHASADLAMHGRVEVCMEEG